MKIKQLLISAQAAAIASATAAKPVQADNTGNLLLPDSITEQFSITSLGEFLGALVTLVYIIAGVLVFIYIVWGGIAWILSGGDQGKTDEARGRIVAALTGMTIVALSYALIRLVEYFFGITVFGDIENLPRPF